MNMQEPTSESTTKAEIETSKVDTWIVPEYGFQRKIDAVHLGGDDPHDYQDRSRTSIPGIGISFGIDQAPHGFTGIFAGALEGYKVEALAAEPSPTDESSWVESRESHDIEGNRFDEVRVAADPGKLLSETQDSSDLGNPGPREGVIRVTDQNGNVKYYLLGADFQGKSNDWQVTGEVIEIQPPKLV